MDSINALREDLVIAKRIAGVRLRGQLQYRVSFIMQILGNFIINFAEIIALFILFQQFSNLGGWSLQEVIFLHGLSQVMFGFGDLLSNGIQFVPEQVRSGDFDRVMLRPVSIYMQSIVSDVSLRHLGMMAQGVLVLSYALIALPIEWTAAKVVYLGLILVTGTALFLALFTIEAILSFWTVNSVEAINAFTYGGSDLGQYPLHIFNRPMRWFFLWIVPVGFVTFYPALFILDKPDPLGLPAFMPFLPPFVVLVFCGAVAWCWRQGVNHYRSTGS